MDGVSLQIFLNFLVSRARTAVLELQDRARGGRLTDSYASQWYTRLLEEMVPIMIHSLKHLSDLSIDPGNCFNLHWLCTMLWLVLVHTSVLQVTVSALLRSAEHF
jgi:hypothetical protein